MNKKNINKQIVFKSVLMRGKYQHLVISSYCNILSRFFKNGLYIQYSKILSQLILIFYYEMFVYNSSLQQFSIKNFLDLLTSVINLVKPPFVIQTTTVPKKLKRKIKLKYLVKIVYKNESLRSSIAIKQLINNCTTFADVKIKYRLYKSVLTTFLQKSESILFKKKILIFKKFFRN